MDNTKKKKSKNFEVNLLKPKTDADNNNFYGHELLAPSNKNKHQLFRNLPKKKNIPVEIRNNNFVGEGLDHRDPETVCRSSCAQEIGFHLHVEVDEGSVDGGGLFGVVELPGHVGTVASVLEGWVRTRSPPSLLPSPLSTLCSPPLFSVSISLIFFLFPPPSSSPYFH
jgi:hypothetical protein